MKLAETEMTEGTNLDFKSEINWQNDGEVIELIKDIIAMANSGGGCILFGINDDGTYNDDYTCNLYDLDPAVLANKIRKYTNTEFDRFSLIETNRSGRKIFTIVVDSSTRSIVFEKPGLYPNPKEPGKQRTAFGQGTIYFRHGAKSETANNIDLSTFIERELERIKDSWLGNIRKVVEAPAEYTVHMLPPNVVMKETYDATAIRITEDQNAPAYKIENPDKICPYRQKDILRIINERLGNEEKINQYDIQAIVHAYGVDNSKPNYFYKSLYGQKQYSEAFVNWVIEKHQGDSLFFTKAREAYKNKAL